MIELGENDKKFESYIEIREYYPYFFLRKIDDGNFDKDIDDSVFIDKDIVEIFNNISILNGIKQSILEYLYDLDSMCSINKTLKELELEEFCKKAYNENIVYLNKNKELLMKLKDIDDVNKLKKEKKIVSFNLKEFNDFFFSLNLNCSFNEGNIESVDGILLKGKIMESKTYISGE